MAAARPTFLFSERTYPVNTKKPKLVLVDWIDTVSDGGWTSRSTMCARQPALNRSAGFLLKRTKRVVTLAMSQGIDCDNFSESLTIPAGNVRRVRNLKP